MTALPESEAATSLLLNALFSNSRRMASATAEPSMIAPSTMLSGGTGWLANATTLNPLPTAFNSTALTALDPMSRPITDFDLPRPNTSYVLWIELGRGHLDRNYSSAGSRRTGTSANAAASPSLIGRSPPTLDSAQKGSYD